MARETVVETAQEVLLEMLSKMACEAVRATMRETGWISTHL
jgi:hypothetical protein